jgi:3-deoxy-D-manno-octulosonate 8-phosphate phosphatase (KDO 8-P phosphatase)
LASPEIFDTFHAAGGRFVTPVEELTKKLDQCRAIVFDWDGVFNTGQKGHTAASGFSEADSMGTNMLRYGLWRTLGELPYTAIISGEDNQSAIAFAERERLTAVYTGIRKKQDVIAHLCAATGLLPLQIACVFDDINDLPDYVTGATAGNFAVREACELLLACMGTYDETLDSRIASDDDYEAYFTARQAVVTATFGPDFGIQESSAE